MKVTFCNGVLCAKWIPDENRMTVLDNVHQKIVFDDDFRSGIYKLLRAIRFIKEKANYTYIENVGNCAQSWEVHLNYLLASNGKQDDRIKYEGEYCLFWSDADSSSWLYQKDGVYYIEIGHYERREEPEKDQIKLVAKTLIPLRAHELSALEELFLDWKKQYIEILAKR